MRIVWQKGRWGAVLGLFVCMFAARVEATTLLRMSVEDMTAASEAVVVGEVTDLKSSWNEAQTTIYTMVIFKVDQCLSGTCGDTIMIKQRGGTVGEMTLQIPGMPKFSKGQKALLFLEPDPEGVPGFYYVVGMCQGIFDIQTDGQTGKLVAEQQGGAALAEVDADGVIRILGPQAPAKLPLVKLIKRIKHAALSKTPAKKLEVKP